MVIPSTLVLCIASSTGASDQVLDLLSLGLAIEVVVQPWRTHSTIYGHHCFPLRRVLDHRERTILNLGPSWTFRSSIARVRACLSDLVGLGDKGQLVFWS